MKHLLNFYTILMLLVFASAAGFSQTFETGKVYNGFTLIEKKFVKEINSDCYIFEHNSSGAKLIKIANADANKTFMIGFKTTPESDDGSPHIMEHCVLNGSKSFPVKSPFDILMKGSLNTFINAFTGNDRTMYPVASMNSKDYYNLMNVYLDAVFNPLLYDDPRILAQEGWHYELTKKDGPVVYRGIVYNEMKGAYSSPSRELDLRIMKNLFPDNFYRFSSGGYPAAIPELTQEKFIAFHKKYYHPSNSRIVIYGDANLNEELKFINDNYLSKYNSKNDPIEYPIQKPFSSMQEYSGTYSVTEGSKTDNQTFLTLSYVTGLGSNQKLVYALSIISAVLVDQETAPIRKALEEAGIGQDVAGDFSNLNQNIFTFEVKNANIGDKEKFKSIIINKLKEAAEKGLDKDAVEGAFNRIEFQTREMNSAQLGLMYGFRAVAGWNYGNDPLLMLEYENVFKELRSDIKNGYLEKVIKEYFIDNNHSLLLTLSPEPGLEKKKNAEAEQKLQEYKSSLSDSELDNLIKSTEELIKYQKEDDTPEALSSIPVLDINDINPKAKFYDILKDNINGIPVLKYPAFTNNVIYFRNVFDMRVLPQELIPYAALLQELLGNLSTENYSYGDLEKNLNIHTGGFSSNVQNYLEGSSDENLLPKFVVSSKVMNNKVDKMLEFSNEIINKTKFDDKERIKNLLVRLQASLETRIKSDGYDYAYNRLRSYYSKDGMLADMTQGLEYYWFIADLVKNFDANYITISDNLKKTSQTLFNKNNLSFFIVCSEDDYASLSSGIKSASYSDKFPDSKVNLQNWNFVPSKKNEGFLTASKVQYVIQGFDFKKLGYKWSGKMRFLNQVLSRDYLYNTIRIIGGAYGGRCHISPTGELIFGSYRDPNLTKTFENYNGAVNYISTFNPSPIEMKRYIIGSIARLDVPMSPLQEGTRALKYYYEKTTASELQKEREEVLNMTVEDVKTFAGMIEAMLKQNYICVYGNETAVNDNKTLFNSVLKITK